MGNRYPSIHFLHTDTLELVSGSSSHCFPLHTHHTACVGIVTGGRLSFQLGKQGWVLDQDEIYIIPPNFIHTITSVDGQAYDHLAICLPENNQWQSRITGGVIRNKAFGKNLAAETEHFVNNQPNTLLDELRQLLQPEQNTTPVVVLDNEIINQAKYFISTHLFEPFYLDTLSNALHISKFHLLRTFKQHTGLSPHQYYIQEKIRGIRMGLLQMQAIPDLAYQYQFTDQSHLCRVFKKYVGVTPGNFRDAVVVRSPANNP